MGAPVFVAGCAFPISAGGVFGSMPWLGAGAGSRPGGRGTFLCFAKEKYPKERRPCCLRPSASLRATWGARARGAPWNSLCAARAAQTTTASQITKRVCPAAHPPPRALRAPGAARRDGEPAATRAIAALGPVSRAQAPRAAQPGPSAAMARGVVWMFGGSPHLAAPAAVRLRGEHARRSAHASSSSSPWLSERRAQRKASSTAHPASAPTQVAP